MTTVRTVVRPGWVQVTGPDVTAVVEVAERHADALANAAADGVVQLLDILCSRGLLVMPSFGVVVTGGGGVRVILRGAATVEVGGRVVTAQDREPWSDVDLDDVGDEVVLGSPEPEPEVARGWRRPSRLRAGAAAVPAAAVAAPDAPAAVPEAPAGSDEGVEPQAPEQPEPTEPAVEAEHAANAEPTTDEEPAEEGQEEPDEASAAPPEPPAAPVPPADLTLPPPEDAAGSAPADRVPPSPPPETGIIDSVPWRRGGAATAAATAAGVPSTAPAPPTPAPTETYAPPGSPESDAPDAPGSTGATDDASSAADPEHTVAPEPEHYPAPEATPRPDATPAADVTTSRDSLPRSDEELDLPVVLAVLCPAGHHSPPHAGRCRTCGREIPPQQPSPIPRPSLGVLRISTGGVVPLDRGVLLGRAPRVNEELPPNQRPHLIRVGGVDRDISRNHAEVVLEGWHVLVRDLGSTNGTTVALPGEEPVRLRPTEDQGIEPGSVITLADEVSLTYEVEG